MKRFLSILLTVALISTSFIFTDTNTVKAADKITIDSIEHMFLNPQSVDTLIRFSDGSGLYLKENSSFMVPKGFIDVKFINNSYLYIDKDKNLYTGTSLTGTMTKMAENVIAIGTNPTKNDAWYVTESGHVYAYGDNTSGTLGVGYTGTVTTPVQVVDPDSAYGDPLTGIKKVLVPSINSVFLIGDGKVYVLGNTLQSSPASNGYKFKDVTSYFPTFTSADDFTLGFLGLPVLSVQLEGKQTTSFALNYGDTFPYFTINGESYVFSDVTANLKGLATNSLHRMDYATQVFKWTQGSIEEATRAIVSRYYGTTNNYNAQSGESLIALTGEEMSYIGQPVKGVGTAEVTGLPNPFVTTWTAAASPVSKVLGTTSGVYFLRNGSLYYSGNNDLRIGGITTKAIENQRVPSSAGEFDNLVDISVISGRVAALRSDGNLYVPTSNTTPLLARSNVTSIYTVPIGRSIYTLAVYADGTFELLNATGISVVNIVPYSALPTSGLPSLNVDPSPAVPTYTLSTDKFNNTVVNVDYGAETVKEYSLDGGTTWLTYTGPVTIPTVGNSVFQARAGNGTTYSDVMTVNITNNPLTIPTGYPTLTESDGKVTIDNNIPGTKVQVSVDGGSFFDYTMPFPISDGSHSIEVVLINTGNGLEISRRTDTVTSTEGTETISTPTLSVANKVGSDFRRELTATYDSSQGDLMVSFDGGTTYVRFEDGNNYVANDNVSVLAKVVSSSGKESGVFTLYVTQIKPNLIPTSDGFYLDLSKFVLSSDIKVQYEFDGDATPFGYEYTGQVTGLAENSYTINLRFTNTATNETLDLGSYPFTVTDTDDNSQLPPEVSDPLGDTEVELGVIGGGLSGQFKGVDLSVIQIDSLKDYQSIVSSSKAIIEDSRGTGEGWHYSLKITDFISDPVMDASTTQQDLRVKIPTNALSVDIKPSVKISGQDSQVGALGLKTFSTNEEYLAKADILQGMGSYEVPLDFTFTVPNKVEVVSVGGGSALTPGDTVGLRVGTYRSTFTFTLVSGI